MNITVIGAGNMGAAFVKQLTRAGHKVAVTARNLDKAQAVAASNPGASAVVIGNAAAQADASAAVSSPRAGSATRAPARRQPAALISSPM